MVGVRLLVGALVFQGRTEALAVSASSPSEIPCCLFLDACDATPLFCIVYMYITRSAISCDVVNPQWHG